MHPHPLSQHASDKSKSSATVLGCCSFIYSIVFLGLQIWVYTRGTDTKQAPEQCNTTMMQSLMLSVIVSSSLAFVAHIATVFMGGVEALLRRNVRHDGGLVVSGCFSFTFQFFGKLMDLLAFILIVILSVLWLSSSCDTTSELYAAMRFFLIAYWAYFAFVVSFVLCLLCCTCCVVGGLVGFAALLGLVDTSNDEYDTEQDEHLLSDRERV